MMSGHAWWLITCGGDEDEVFAAEEYLIDVRGEGESREEDAFIGEYLDERCEG